MKTTLAVSAFMTLFSVSSLACSFQGEVADNMKYSQIECNETQGYAIVHNPQIKIKGKFKNILGAWTEKSIDWEVTTKRGWFASDSDVEVKRKKIVNSREWQISSQAKNQICSDLGFSGSSKFEYSTVYMYFKKAYSIDRDVFFTQSPKAAPIGKIYCY